TRRRRRRPRPRSPTRVADPAFPKLRGPALDSSAGPRVFALADAPDSHAVLWLARPTIGGFRQLVRAMSHGGLGVLQVNWILPGSEHVAQEFQAGHGTAAKPRTTPLPGAVDAMRDGVRRGLARHCRSGGLRRCRFSL